MTDRVLFIEWKRKPDMGPGHARILVYESEDGSLCPPLPEPKTGRYVQCATLDRVPFVMKDADLKARYERGA